MTRSTDFGRTVKRGVRVSQPDLVVHARREPGEAGGPRIGYVVNKSVGCAVDRHRVARRLRHVTMSLVGDLRPEDRLVVRALPSSSRADSARLRQQLTVGVQRSRELMERRR